MERVVYAPVQNLRQIILTPSDEQDLRDVQPFQSSLLPEIVDYNILEYLRA